MSAFRISLFLLAALFVLLPSAPLAQAEVSNTSSSAGVADVSVSQEAG